MRFLLFFWLIFPFLGGCDLWFNYQTVTVLAPPAPTGQSGYWSEPAYRLLLPGRNGQVEERKIAKGSKSLRVSLAKKNNLFLVAYPQMPSPRQNGFRPAGAFIPHDLDTAGAARLSWERGFLAETALQAHRDVISIDSFNLGRLIAKIKETAPENPWFIDRQRLLNSLLSKRFYSGFVKKATVQSLEIHLTRGHWLWSDPFLPAANINGAEKNLTFSLYPGLFYLYQKDFKKYRVINIEKTRWTYLSVPEGDVISGNW